jgi:hypothetical protein
MTYIPDLMQEGIVVRVGYLSREHEYARGEVSDLVFESLVRLGQVQFPNCTDYLGYHHCDLGSCGLKQVQEELYWRGIWIPRSCRRDIWVPDRAVIYNTPQLILHYVRAHRYLPPASFLDAILNCPEPGSEMYRAEIKRIAPDYGMLLG